MKFKYNKYIYIDIFENQIHSVIMINGKKITLLQIILENTKLLVK